MTLLDWFKNKKTPDLEPETTNAQIRIVGDRSSGKTTYMASLAYWPNAKPESPVQYVTPTGEKEASAQLIKYAQDILEQGLELEAAELLQNVNEVRDYGLLIELKDKFSKRLSKLGSENLRLSINCKDYSGEFFSDLIHKAGDPRLKDYLDDCVLATGILLLIDGTSHAKDSDYANGLETFFAELDRADLQQEKRRIAFVINKCELPQLWVSRNDPKGLATRRFPLTKNKLETWKNIGAGEIDYFTVSAFGTVGNKYPEPNTTTLKRDRFGTTSVIREPRLWRPFGLVSPIYWLCTGERNRDLDKD